MGQYPVTWRWYPDRYRRRRLSVAYCHEKWQSVGNRRHVALPIRYAVFLYQLHLVSCQQTISSPRSVAQIRSCFDLSAYRRQLFPIMLIALREADYWGWGILSFVWLCALAGIILCFCNLKEHSNLETICYIAMGCSIFVGFKPLCQHVPPAFIYWLIGEGVSYITGAVFYSFPKLPYMHSVFHLFVLGGTVCHMMALWYIL